MSKEKNRKIDSYYWITMLLFVIFTGVIFFIPDKTSNNTALVNETSFNCPFCSGHAILQREKNMWVIECDNEECGYRTVRFETERAAVDYWKNVFGE